MAVRQRVFVTGIGLVTPLGRGTQHVWSQLMMTSSSISGVRQIVPQGCRLCGNDLDQQQALIDATDRAFPGGKIARQALMDLDGKGHKSKKIPGLAAMVRHGSGPGEFPLLESFLQHVRRDLRPAANPLHVRYALAAAAEAAADAGLIRFRFPQDGPEPAAMTTGGAGAANSGEDAAGIPRLGESVDGLRFSASNIDVTRVGVSIASAVGGIGETEAETESGSARTGRVSPYYVPRLLVNMPAGVVAIALGACGPNMAAGTACAAGAHAIGDAMRAIQHGEADIMIAGGTESCITPLTLAGFARAGALSTRFNASPHLASRPFDADRDGFVLGEGAAVLVLESEDSVRRRSGPVSARSNIQIYAEVAGYGRSADALHITNPALPAPPRTGGVPGGAFRAMQLALLDANAEASDLSYINAHATSTPVGDVAEAESIQLLLENSRGAERVPVSSTKGCMGHLLGAAGAAEAAVAVLAAKHNAAPGTANLQNLCGDYPRLAFPKGPVELAKHQDRTTTLSNSFGFGGTNACLVFRSIDDFDI